MATYNVSGGSDDAALVEVLESIHADVVCVVGIRRKIRRALQRSGLVAAMRVGRNANALVAVREGVLVRSVDRVELTTPKDGPDRMAAHAIVSVGGLTLSVLGTDFGLRPEVRQTNLEELSAVLTGTEPPSVVCVSLPETSTGPVARQLAIDFQDAFAVAGTGAGGTYPAADPVSRRDFVFVDRSLEVASCHAADGENVPRAGRHRPVVAEIAGRATADDHQDAVA